MRSVYEQTRGIQFEVIVLDNASRDGCAEMLAAEFPAARFIQGEENLGFARGNNLAAKQAAGEMLLFLNPDTELRGPAVNKLFEALVSLAEAGAVGARLLNTDGTLQTSCIQAFPTIANQVFDAELARKWSPRGAPWGTAPRHAKTREPVLVEGISGACLLTRRTAFEQVGGFSEDYFMYYEDMDYCLKVRKAGWKNYYAPEAVVVHHGGKSSGAGEQSRFSSVTMAESAWRFFCKERGRPYAGAFRVCLAAMAAGRLCLLSLLYPLTWPSANRRRISGAWRKWAFVFRWAFGAEKALAGRYLPRSAA